MKRYGLIGYPLAHSFSERYFREKFAAEGIADCSYSLFPLADIDLLPKLLKDNPSLRGLNVTIPYKEAVLPYLTRLDEQAAAIGAVNCVRIDGSDITGYNTDIYGFRRSLLELIGPTRPQALVLGTGGASKAVAYVLRELGIEYDLVSRTKTSESIGYKDITCEVAASRELIVNATPLGTYPDMYAAPPLPYAAITEAHFLFDLVYNPEVTRFLALGRERGARTVNGWQMLVSQAEKSWEIWNSSQ